MGKPGGKKMGGKKHVNRNMGKRWKTKYERLHKDVDQIDADLAPENAYELLNQRVDLDKPGEGQHYCIHCGIYFINKVTLAIHLKTKKHKKRVKELRLAPHTQEEAERAAGMGNFIMPIERIVRDLTADDQVRDEDYVQVLDEEEMKDIQDSLSSGIAKKKDTIFIAVKSKSNDSKSV